MLFDAHCHLQDARLAARLPEVLRQAAAAGVGRMLCCGCNEGDWAAVQRLAEQHPVVAPAFGMHPCDLQGRSAAWPETLERMLLAVPSGVGEIGLDHALDVRNDAEQEEVFLTQLRLARKLRRPVSIHCRRAWGRLVELLKLEGGVWWGGQLHSYSGPPDLVPGLEAMGLYLSFSGMVTRSGNKRGHRAAAAVSPKRLLIETDSPDLLPSGATTDSNEPGNLPLIAAAVARIRGVTIETIEQQTWENACRLFAIIRE